LTGAAALELIKELGGDRVGICSLPALVHEIPRQVATVRNLKHLIFSTFQYSVEDVQKVKEAIRARIGELV